MLKEGPWGALGVRGRLQSLATTPQTAWNASCWIWDVGWWLMHFFSILGLIKRVYYLFSSFYTFSFGNNFIKIPLLSISIMPLNSLHFAIILSPLTFPAHSRILHAVSLFVLYLPLFSTAFLVQILLKASLWYFKFHLFYSYFFTLASLFIASTWGHLVFSVRPLVSGPLSLGTSSYHIIF